MDQIDLSIINTPNTIKYKRILFYGIIDINPSLNEILDKFGIFYDDAGRKSFCWIKSNLFPSLVIWETSDGQKKYAQINKTTNKINRK